MNIKTTASAAREDIAPYALRGDVDSVKAYRIGWLTSRSNRLAARVQVATFAQEPVAAVRAVVDEVMAEFAEEDAEFERAMGLAADVRRMAGAR